MRIRHEVDIEAPLDKVWDLTLDIEAWPTITPTMTSLTPLDDVPLAVGSKVRIKQPGQRARVWTVTALDPRRRFAWSTTMLGVTMTGAHHLAATSIGTRNTLTIDLDGALAPVVGTILRWPLGRALARENEGFKTEAER